ncbi:MAG: hypothetical protein HYZ94_03635 [Candidatus Omnitrophica bacterium]|nr:hypothetical protein [Candidatus Omnitrophota bacterium]
MALRLDTPYYVIPGSRSEGTFGAILEILLKTRVKLHLDTDKEAYDEDVNAYLGGLLVSYIDPQHLLAVSDLLSKYQLDVYEAVHRAQDHVESYRIYKANADDLLVSLGIFHRFWREEKGDVGLLKHYYDCASEYQKRIYRKSTAVGQIQARISEETERYLTILSEARAEYLHFVERLGAEQLGEFARRIETEFPLKARQDELLDAYSAWVREPGKPEARTRLIQAVEELKKLDPAFQPEAILNRLSSP